MKNIIWILIIIICTSIGFKTVTVLSASAQTTNASVAGDRHPELVSGQIAFEQSDDYTGGTENFFLRNWGVHLLKPNAHNPRQYLYL